MPRGPVVGGDFDPACSATPGVGCRVKVGRMGGPEARQLLRTLANVEGYDRGYRADSVLSMRRSVSFARFAS